MRHALPGGTLTSELVIKVLAGKANNGQEGGHFWLRRIPLAEHRLDQASVDARERRNVLDHQDDPPLCAASMNAPPQLSQCFGQTLRPDCNALLRRRRQSGVKSREGHRNGPFVL
jgi:hypothetical protein